MQAGSICNHTSKCEIFVIGHIPCFAHKIQVFYSSRAVSRIVWIFGSVEFMANLRQCQICHNLCFEALKGGFDLASKINATFDKFRVRDLIIL
jgi:hypothetical protein